IIQKVAGNLIVDSVVKVDANKPPAREVWVIATGLLHDLSVGLFVYGLLFVIAAFLAGPTRLATAIRRWLAPTVRRRAWLGYGVATLVFLMVIAWSPTAGGRRLIGVLVLAALVALGLEVWRRQTLREFPSGDEVPEAQPVPGPSG